MPCTEEVISTTKSIGRNQGAIRKKENFIFVLYIYDSSTIANKGITADEGFERRAKIKQRKPPMYLKDRNLLYLVSSFSDTLCR